LSFSSVLLLLGFGQSYLNTTWKTFTVRRWRSSHEAIDDYRKANKIPAVNLQDGILDCCLFDQAEYNQKNNKEGTFSGRVCARKVQKESV